MKAMAIGIMPQDKIRERTLAIACGDYKPKAGEPKVWFASMKTLAAVLSDDNRALLKIIIETKPESISALAEITGRKPGSLSRTLKAMSNYGVVDLKREESGAFCSEGYRVSDCSGVDKCRAQSKRSETKRIAPYVRRMHRLPDYVLWASPSCHSLSSNRVDNIKILGKP